ncbi:MAG: hypothetical protein AAF747_12205, partial [Planctomycetota bacterium]
MVLSRFAIACSLCAAAVCASAQPWVGLRPFEVEAASLEEAIAKAEAEAKVLVVYPVPHNAGTKIQRPGDAPGQRQTNSQFTLHRQPLCCGELLDPGPWFLAEIQERMWNHPVLNGWLEQHAITYRFDPSENAGAYAEIKELTDRPIDRFPHVLFFVDGQLEMTAPRIDPRAPCMGNLLPAGDCPTVDEDGRPMTDIADPGRMFPKGMAIVEAGEALFEKLATTDAVWLMRHEFRNAAPVVPELELLHTGADGLLPPVTDPANVDAASLIARLAEADQALAAGDVAKAAALLTWLWERGPTIDPAFAPVRGWAVGVRMNEAGSVLESARERFRRMHDALGKRHIDFTDVELFDYAVLGETVSREAWTVEYMTKEFVSRAEADYYFTVELPIFTPEDEATKALLTARDRW